MLFFPAAAQFLFSLGRAFFKRQQRTDRRGRRRAQAGSDGRPSSPRVSAPRNLACLRRHCALAGAALHHRRTLAGMGNCGAKRNASRPAGILGPLSGGNVRCCRSAPAGSSGCWQPSVGPSCAHCPILVLWALLPHHKLAQPPAARATADRARRSRISRSRMLCAYGAIFASSATSDTTT